VYSIHATKKLLDRVKRPVADPVGEPSTMLGNWYPNALFWKPQVAVLVNERTLLPVFMLLAPASALAERFPDQLGRVLEAIGVPVDFVAQELLAMEHASFAKTANRSVVGSMNDFAYLAEFHQEAGEAEDLVSLSASLAETPCSPLYQRHTSPDREVRALVAEWSAQ
jgi:hypothetical protein